MRLLIVEDQEVQAMNLKKILEIKGFAVDWVSSAEKARARLLLYKSDYSVVLLDLGLPGLDGMWLLKSVREEGITVPVIVLTGQSETEHKVALLNAGADDYVIKPFSSEELISRIHAIMRRPSISQPVIQRVGDLEINTSERSVKAGDQPVSLTLKEYSLLECFVRRPNEVLKREDLCNQVWDFNSLTLSNVLDVHMKNLRKKLQTEHTAVRFETVRGVGYRLTV